MTDRRPSRLPVLLLAAVVAVAGGLCAVRAYRAVPEMIPPNKNGSPNGTPYGDPPPLCSTPDPVFVAEFSEDPLITTVPPGVPPGAVVRHPTTLDNCGGADGGVSSTVEDAPPGSQGPVTEHYRALAVAGGWTLSDPPTAGSLLSATRSWRGRTAYFALWLHRRGFRAEITPVPT